ncbi:hypothetical protein ACFE04_002573 [Oxalis oulophora]
MSKRGAKSQLLQGPHNCRLQLLISFLVLSLLILIMLLSRNAHLPNPTTTPLSKRSRFVNASVKLDPVVDFRNGTSVIWQIPDSPKGALFLAHGCSGKADNFWDRSSNCPNCVGLPEERQLVLHALSRKFAVIAISSLGRCWTLGKERLIVKDILKWWISRNKLEKLPLFALGASSGGYFVSALANDLKLSSITLMIAEGVFDRMEISEDYPPTLFVHMPKDLYRQQKITEFMDILKIKGIDAAEVECNDVPLSSNFLANRISGFDINASSKLFELFQKKGFVDKNGYMRKDGRATPWKEAVRKSNGIFVDEKLFDHIQEELNLAFAYHEMTSLPSEQIFNWFQNHRN